VVVLLVERGELVLLLEAGWRASVVLLDGVGDGREVELVSLDDVFLDVMRMIRVVVGRASAWLLLLLGRRLKVLRRVLLRLR
jgi:hypothetical protein